MAGYSQQVKLQFMADTSQPQKQLQQLATQLQQISSLKLENTGMNKQIDQAVKSAEILQTTLQKAVNVNTGKLNLNTFTSELNKSGTSVAQLSANLLQIGPAGAQAFRSLATSIASAELPVRRMNATLRGMLTSLANTVKWQLSSSAVHGLMSGFSSAVGYVKDLNRALNDIRIVTGQSVDDMARFAEQANKAAKALSTTTKAYANASLIYYQQGDSQEMAAKKAAITIKAANASFGSSTKEMSEYLTAVWNSYQVGADELERYVDIMAALGAKTATSLEEIATSMQKVAATANTVGVSMEQVSSIISTVSSVTRESAESIGTSYKTIFARMGDLKLGGTDDGVGLGQVSSQLKSIGVEILTTSGELRDMGDIITDLGNKWQTMNNAQKAATAQAVAGKRQYTQLMALFENWDMYNKNLNIAQNSEGELQQMADVYAESWAAASDRVRAAWESVWSSLLNDEALIKMMNSLAEVVSGIENVIDGFGGLEGVLFSIGNVLTTVFQKNIADNIDKALLSVKTFKQSFEGMSKGQAFISFFSQNTFQRQQQKYSQELIQANNDYMRVGRAANNNFGYTDEGRQLYYVNELVGAKQRLAQVGDKLNLKDKEASQDAIKNLEQQILKLNQLTQEKQEAYNSVGAIRSNMVAHYNGQASNIASGGVYTNNEVIAQTVNSSQSAFAGVNANAYSVSVHYKDLLINAEAAQAALEGVNGVVTKYGNSAKMASANGQQLEDSLREIDTAIDILISGQADGIIKGVDGDVAEIQRLRTALGTALEGGNTAQIQTALEALIGKLKQFGQTVQQTTDQAGQEMKEMGFGDDYIAELKAGVEALIASMQKIPQAANGANRAIKKFANTAASGAKASLSWGQGFSALASGFMSFSTTMSSAAALAQDDGESMVQTISSTMSIITSIVMAASIAMQASNPFGWITLALSVLGVAFGSWIGNQEKKMKEFEEKQKKRLKEWEDKVNEDKTEIDERTNLIKQYNELYETYRVTGQGQEELAETAYELAKAYDVLGANVLIAENNFQSFTEAITKKLNLRTQIQSLDDVINNAFGDWGETDGTYALTAQGVTTAGQASAYQYIVEGSILHPIAQEMRIALGELYNATVKSMGKNKGVPIEFTEDLNNQMKEYVLENGLTVWESILQAVNNNEEVANFVWQSLLNNAGLSIGKGFLPTRTSAITVGDLTFSGTRVSEDVFTPWDAYLSSLSFSSNPDLNPMSLQYDVSRFYDSHGNFIWDDLSGTEKYMRYTELRQELPKVQGILAQINALSEEDQQPLIQYKEYLEAIAATYNDILTNDANVTMMNTISDAYALRSRLQFENETLLKFLGKGEDNTSFSEYSANMALLESAITDAMEIDPKSYESLTEFMIDDGDGTFSVDPARLDEYNQARQKLISQLMDDYTSFDEFTRIYESIAFSFSSLNTIQIDEHTITSEAELVKQYVQTKGINTIKEFSSEMINALNYLLDSGIYQFDNNALLNSILAAGTQQTTVEETKIKAETTRAYAENFSEDMDYQSANQLVSSISWGQNNIIAFDDFIRMDYQERQSYLESIADTYDKTVRSEADALVTLRTASRDAWKDLLDDADVIAKYGGLYGASNGYSFGNKDTDINAQTLMQQYIAWRTAQGYVDSGNGIYNLDGESYDEDTIWSTFLTNNGYGDTVKQTYNDVTAFLSMIAGGGQAQLNLDNAQNMVMTFQLMDSAVESTATQIERLSKALSQLPTNAKDLQKIADALYGGNVDNLMGSTAAGRANQMIAWLSKNRPTLTTTTSYNFKDYAQYRSWAEGKQLSIIEEEDFNAGKFTLPNGMTWEQIEQDLGEGTNLVATEVNDWGQYLADIASYDKAMGAVLAIKNQGAKDTLDQLQALEAGFEDFVESGVMSDETKNALELLGIDPDTINSVDDYVKAINKVSTARTTYANTLKTNLQTYDDNLGFSIDWTEMDTGLSYEEFVAEQTQLTEAQRNSLLLMTNFAQAYEQWRQAEVEADDAGIDTDAIKARDAMNKAIATSTQNIEKLEQAATKAKTAVDALNGALGNSQPLSFEAIEQLKQAGVTATNWGNGTGAGALGIYGTALGKSAMAQIDALIAKQTDYALAQSTIRTNDEIYHLSPADRADLGLPEPTEIDRRKTFNFDLMSLENADERDKLIQSMGFNGAAIEQINAMIKAAKESGSSLTWSDIFTNLSKYNGELDGAMSLIWAQFKDDGVQAVQAILQAEQDAAQKTVDVWRNAFSAIIAAKQGMAEGKTLGESLAGDEGQLAVVLATAHQLGIDPMTLLSGNGGANWASITGHANFQFNPAKYAESLGGATQFLYGPDGLIATDYHDMYGHASTRFHTDIDTYWAQATAGKSEAELIEMGLTATSKEEMIAQLLKYYFPDGYWSTTEQEYHDAIGAVQAPEYASKIKQARADFDAATTLYNKDYETRMARIGVYKEIEEAVAQSMLAENKGKTVSDIIGAERMAEIEAQYGITAAQVNSSGVQSWISSGISTEMAAINESYATYLATVEEIDNLDLIGTVDSLTADTTKQLDAMNLLYGDGSTRRYEAMTNIIKNLAEAYGMSEEGMRRYIIAADKANGGSGQITADTLKLANAMLAQQAAVDAATESLDDYISTIQKGDKTSIEYQNSLDGVRKIVGGLLGLDANATQGLSETLLADTEFLALLQKIINGEATDADWAAFKTKYTNDTASTNKNDVSGTKFTADTTKGKDTTFKDKIAKIQHEAKLLEQEMEALNSIDITEMPMAGTAAYEALSASLQKAGKSMSDYSKMSQKERAQALGDAKIAKLGEQKIKNAELIKAYENKYNFEDAGYTWDDAVEDKLTAEYQAYLDAKQRELELNQEIADAQQETQNQINEIGAADAEARIAALEAEREIVQDTVDAYTELADIMMRAAETGKLTAEEMLKIQRLDQNLLTSWDNATTYAERVNIAAQARLKAMTQEVTAQQEAIDGMAEAQILIAKKGIDSTSIYKNTSFADEDAFKTLMSQHLSAAGLDAVMKAWQTVNSKMTSTSTLTDFYNELEAELARMEAEGVEGIEEIKATAQDAMAEMYGDLGEYEVSMAQTVVDTWLKAFKQIAEARKQLIMGEDIGDSLTESWESYLALAQAYGDGSLWTAYRSGALKSGDLKYQSETKLIEGLRDSMGMSTINTPGKNLFDKNGNLLLGDALGDALGMEKTATRTVKVEVVDAQGNKSVKWQEEDAYDEAAILEYAAPYLKELMTNYGDLYTGTDSIDALIEKALAGDPAALAWIKKAYTWMDQTTKDYATAVKEDARLAEVQATYDAKVQELTEQRDKAKLGASATDAIQETEESDRTADTVAAALQQAGISPEAYMAMLREKGYDVNTLDDVAKLTDAQLEAVETSLEQDALAAGQAIISAAQIFHAIVTSGGDEAALTAKLAALGVTRDANGNIQGFGQYQGAGLNYGENTAVGQQASDNVTEATEEQNTLKNEYGVNQTEDINTRITRAAELAGMSMEELREYADYLKELGEINGETEEQNLLLAASYARIQKGLKDVQSNLKTYTKTLKEAKKGTVDHKKALDSMRTVYGDVLDLDNKGMKALSEEFMTQEDVLKDLEDAANGVDGAYDRLQEKATKHILDNLTGDADISSMTDEITTLATAVNQLPEGAVLDWNELLGQGTIGQAVASNLSSLASFVNGLASSASEASSIMQALAAALGMDMEIEQKDFDVTQYEWQASAGGAVGYGPDGSQVYVPLNVEAIPVEGTVTGWSIKTITNKGTYGGGIKGGSTGGGGGGNKKPKQAKKIKFEDEVDRYHEVNQRLERMSELLDKIDKYKARAFGKGYLKNLEQETKMLKAQQAMYERKMEEAKLYYEQDSANMANKYGATFDEYGNMSNYDEVLAGIIANENSKIDYYNSLSAAEQEKLDEQYEHDGGYLAYIAKMREDFKKDLAKMEDSAATLGEATSAFEEVINQISANNLEAITYKAEYQIELNDADRKLLQFYVDRYEDDVNKQAESFEKLIAQGEKLANNTEALTQKQKDLETAYANGEITQADYAKGLQETRDALLENAQALLELEKNVKEFYGNTLEMISDAFHEQVDHITAATDAMQSYINILGLMGKGQNYSEKALFYGQRAEFAQQEAIAKKAHLDLLLGQKADFDALIASGKEMTEVEKQWYEDLLNAIDDANGEFLESVETALTYLQEKYQNAVAKISEDLDKALSGSFGSLEGLSDAYSYYTEVQGRYVSAARELYEVSKLNRDIEMSIEDATTSASKKMLKDLQDRINKQSELNQLTEYDIEMNRLQYELALAKIGLEEAQNAKDTVRLTRDESGNYIYQYTADNDKINEAQQTYEDVLQQINDLALNRVQELEQGFIETRQKYKEQYDAIVNDMNLTDEERAAKLADLNERFKADMEYYAKQMGIAAENLTTSNATIMQVYSDDLRTVSMTTRDGINEDIAALIANKDEAIASFQQAVTDAKVISAQHQADINAFTSATVGDYNAMADAVTKYGDDVDRAMQKAQEAVDESTDAMLDKIRDLGANWESFINGPLDDFIDGIIDLAEEIQNTLDWLAELETATATTPEPGPEPPANINPNPQEPEDDGEGKDTGDKPGGSGNSNKYFVKWHNKSGTFEGYANAQNALNSWRSSYQSAETAKIKSKYDLNTPNGGYMMQQDLNALGAWMAQNPGSITKVYKTGGLADYTGPAWLDGTKNKPELVLNANDTQNMLQTVHSLRELDTESITMLLSALGMATASLFGALNGNYHASGISGSNVQELNQNVEIHADFPNVTDKNEIVEAIDDLVNRASQFAQKKIW